MAQYEISINKGSKNSNHYFYEYNNTKITMCLSRNKIYFCYNLKTQKCFDDVTSVKNKYFIDALMKAYFCNLIKYNEGLKIESITVSIDGEAKEYNQNTPNFPFLLSVIKDCKITLNCADKDNIIQCLINSNKTNINKDAKFIVLVQLLLSKTRDYEFDRFINLWTSMNAFYNYIYKGNTKDYERNKILYLIKRFSIGDNFPKRDDCKKEFDLLPSFDECLMGLKPNEIRKLYDNTIKNENLIKNNSKYNNIQKVAGNLKVSPYGLLLLVYPYYCRCEYFHGTKAPQLFYKKGDKFDSKLKVMNYFLETFIEEKLGLLFTNDSIN